jgi:hypothetical protein
LQEWLEDWDMKAGEMRHRHVSHLYGLYPGRDLHRRDTPEFAAGRGEIAGYSAATKPPAGRRRGASACGRIWATAIVLIRS